MRRLLRGEEVSSVQQYPPSPPSSRDFSAGWRTKANPVMWSARDNRESRLDGDHACGAGLLPGLPLDIRALEKRASNSRATPETVAIHALVFIQDGIEVISPRCVMRKHGYGGDNVQGRRGMTSEKEHLKETPDERLGTRYCHQHPPYSF